ncbi:MAG: DUF2062 domain-containing protein [Planctomycetota bacterium]|jgi:uncharacterized protein (DUF2062 family)
MADTYIFRWLRFRLYVVARQLVKLRATPHAIALGTAIGIFVGMTPTVGLQMLIGVIIATVVGANRVAAALPAWITNPFTIVPIYSFNYWLGTFFVKGPGLEEFKIKISQLSGWRSVYDLGVDILVPLTIGCCLVGIALAIPAYPLAYRMVSIFRRRLQRRKIERHNRVVNILNRRSEREKQLKAESSLSSEAPLEKEADIESALLADRSAVPEETPSQDKCYF